MTQNWSSLFDFEAAAPGWLPLAVEMFHWSYMPLVSDFSLSLCHWLCAVLPWQWARCRAILHVVHVVLDAGLHGRRRGRHAGQLGHRTAGPTPSRPPTHHPPGWQAQVPARSLAHLPQLRRRQRLCKWLSAEGLEFEVVVVCALGGGLSSKDIDTQAREHYAVFLSVVFSRSNGLHLFMWFIITTLCYICTSLLFILFWHVSVLSKNVYTISFT